MCVLVHVLVLVYVYVGTRACVCARYMVVCIALFFSHLSSHIPCREALWQRRQYPPVTHHSCKPQTSESAD